MRLRENLKNVTSEDFWYDLTDGGYLNPANICYYRSDTERVLAAIEILQEFKKSCEEQIEGFVR